MAKKLTLKELRQRCEKAGIPDCNKKGVTKNKLLELLAMKEEEPEGRLSLSNPELYDLIAPTLNDPLPIRSSAFRGTSAWPIIEDELASMGEEDISSLEFILNASSEDIYNYSDSFFPLVYRYPIVIYSIIRGLVTRPKSKISHIKGAALFVSVEDALREKWPELAEAIPLSYKNLLVYTRNFEGKTHKELFEFINYKPSNGEYTAYIDMFIALLSYNELDMLGIRIRRQMFSENISAFLKGKWTNERVERFTNNTYQAMSYSRPDAIFDTNYLKVLYVKLVIENIDRILITYFIIHTFEHRLNYSDGGDLHKLNLKKFPNIINSYTSLNLTVIRTINYGIYFPDFSSLAPKEDFDYPHSESLVQGIIPFQAALAYHILRQFYSTEDLISELIKNTEIESYREICQQILVTYVFTQSLEHSDEELEFIYQQSLPFPIDLQNNIYHIAFRTGDIFSIIPDVPYISYNPQDIIRNRGSSVLITLKSGLTYV